ncbi:MAG TPA: Ig-like domain-containing protein [Steroidobacteraceae bacterium]|nr:Ig-like domain-containing protein [Steroidobacteraceae bacterium]
MTLSATDKAAINTILNKNGTSSTDATTYNLAAAEDWNAGADAAVVIADTTGNGITVSNVPAPSVTSIVRTGGASSTVNTSAASIQYTVTFDESVTGVDATDFALTATGTANGSISSVSGSGTTYTVTVDTLTGDGTLRLDLNGSGTGIQNSSSEDITGGYTSGSTYTLDHTAPSTPSAPDMTSGSDTGTSSSDDITGNTTPTFTGTAESNSTVTLYDTDGTTVLGTTTADGSGNWSITSSTLYEGNHTLTAKAADAAGNVSSASSGLSATIDTTAPAAVGLSATTIATSNATSTSNIATLSATDSQAITYSFAAGNGTNDADNGSFTISGTSLKVGGYSLAAGTYNIFVAATDTAGNVTDKAFTVSIVDAPSVSSIVRTGGASSTVNTSAASIQYTVTFDESVTGVDTSDFSLTPTGTASGAVSSISGSGTTYTVTVDTLTGDGTLRLDLNGSGTGIQNGSNVDITGGYTTGSTYTLDHTAPSAPSAPDMTSGSDTGTSSSDDITSNTTPTFTGTAESNSTVTLYDTDGTTVLGTTTADGSGNWSITTSTLSEGNHTVTAKATDAAGNVSSASSALSATIDTSASIVSSVSVPANGTYKTGDNLDFTVTYNENVIVDTGGGTPGITLALDTGGIIQADYVSGSGTTSLTFRTTVTAGQLDSTGIVVGALNTNGGTLKDAAGNDANLALNSVGSTTNVLVDGIAPSVTSVAVPANGTYVAGQNLDFTVNFDENVVIDTTGGTPRVAITLDTGGTVYADYVSGSSTSAATFRYTVTSGTLDNTGITVGALTLNGGTLKDTAGNDATLTLNSVGSTASVLVEAIPPVITTDAGSASFVAADNATSTPVVIDSGITLVDNGKSTLSSATISLTGNFQSGEDVLAFTNDGSTMGNIAASYSSATGVLTLTSSGGTATVAQWQSALRAVTYTDTAVTPSNATRTISFQADDGLNVSATATRTITVTDTNQTPILTTSGGTAAFVEGNNVTSTPVAIDNGITVSDLDNTTLSSATVAITGNLHGSEDVLAFTNDGSTMGNIAASYNSGTGVLTLTSSGSTATLAQWQSALRSVTYTDTSDLPNTGARTISFTVNDGTVDSAAATRSISVTSTNDAPVNSAPASQNVSQDATLAFNSGNGNLISISDVDANGGNEQITLTATHGTITLSGTTGLSFLVGSGTGDATMTFQGTLTDINNALNGLTYSPASGYNGAASLQVTSNDQGNTGSGGAQSDTDNINITVNPVNPVVTSVSSTTANGGYKTGNTVDLTITFDQAVTVDTTGGTPALLLETGTTDHDATYVSGSGTNTLTFAYVIQSGDNSSDLDYQSTNALSLNGASIANATNNAAILTLPATGSVNSIAGQKDIVIDGIDPTITSVAVPANGTYVAGQNLDFTINTSEAVTIDTAGGTPRIAITLDTGGTIDADYVSGSGTTALTFRATIANGEMDTNGITLSSSIDANGGTLRDAVGNDAVLTLNSVASTANVLVDAIAPTVASVDVPASSDYHAGQTLTFTINTSENVTVDTTGGTPRIALDAGGNTVYANYVSGSGSNALTFQYTVQAGDNDADGIAVSALQSNGGALHDAAGNDLNLTLNSIASTTGVLVDTTAPTATSIVRDGSSPSNSASVSYTVTFSEDVSGVDASDFALTSTGTASGSVASVTTVDAHTYTVNVNSVSGTGTLEVDLKASGTGITDAAGNAINGGLTGAVYSIDRDAPAVTSVAVPADGTYVAGQHLDFTINTSEAVIVDTSGGTPRIAITLDTGGTIDADYVSGSGTTALTFRATIANGEMDTNGITLSSSIDVNGGTLRDAVGNDAVLTLNSVASTANVLVDAVAPAVASVDVPAAGHYNVGDVLTFTINTSENVIVDTTGGVPQLTISIGGVTHTADYVSGSGSNALVFQYTVLASDNGTGLTISNNLVSNGASLHDLSGNALNIGLNNIGTSTGVVIDNVAPAASSLERADFSPTNAGTIHYTLHFSEDVTGLSVNDLALVTTSNVDAQIAGITQVNAHTYTITLTGVKGNGSLQVNLASIAGITDLAGNALTAGINGDAYQVITTVPDILPHHAPPHLPVPGYAHEDHDHGIHGIAEDHSSFATPSFTSPSFITELSSLPVVHSIDVSEHHSFDIPLPWRPVNLASGWSMIELRNADGSAVPTWLHYDVITGALQGTPPATFNGTLQIEIVMTDRHGAHVLGTVELHFSASKASHADNAIAPHAKHGIAKASLDTQFARHANRTAPALNGMHTVSPRSTSTSASIASLSSRV